MANNFPTIRPSLNMNFAGTGVLPPDVTFTRASSSGGYYDGVTVSKAEENLLLYSQDFSNAYWTKNTTSVTADSSVAPDGTSTADTLVSGAGVSPAKGAFRLFTIPASSTLSVYAKAGTSSIGFLTDSANRWAVYDLTAGTVLASNNGAASITRDATTGWCRLVFTPSVAITYFIVGGKDVYASGDPWSNGTWTEANNIIIWGAQLEQRDFATAYTPTTTQPITNYIPKMLFAPANVPVFDHNPTTGEALGLSVWEARTNLLQRSQEFDNAYWNNDSCTVLSNQIIAPDGTLTADKYIPNIGLLPSTASTGIRRPTFAVSSGATYTFSEFAKKGEFDTWATRDNYASGNLLVINLTTGAIVSNPAFYTNVRVIDCGNGWWRIVYTFVATTTNYVTEAARTNSTGDGTSGIYIWGAQLEAGAFATPYIPTVASTVARSADVAVMTGANFSRWYRQDEGSFVAEFVAALDTSTRNRVLSASDAAGNLTIDWITSTSGQVTFEVFNGATQAGLDCGVFSSTVFNKVSGSYKVNSFNAVLNGGTVQTDTTGAVPAGIDRLGIGIYGSAIGSTVLNGYIKSLSYYPIALTSAQHQAVTA